MPNVSHWGMVVTHITLLGPIFTLPPYQGFRVTLPWYTNHPCPPPCRAESPLLRSSIAWPDVCEGSGSLPPAFWQEIHVPGSDYPFKARPGGWGWGDTRGLGLSRGRQAIPGGWGLGWGLAGGGREQAWR